MSDVTISLIPAVTRASLADQLDTVVRELQVLQGVLRATTPTMPLATASTGLIGAMITTREVSNALGAAEGEALADLAEMEHEAEQDRKQMLHDEMINDMMAQDGRWG